LTGSEAASERSGETGAPATGDASQPALSMRGVRFRYGPGREVVRGIDLKVERGRALVVMGPSGCGKTTLLKMANGLLKPDAGSVAVLGKDLLAWRPEQLLRRVGYIPQQLGLVRSRDAESNVLVGGLHRMPLLPSVLGLAPEAERDRARALLDQVGLAGKEGTPVHRLSGGERQRVAIARALMQDPELIVGDEFVSDLDIGKASDIMRLVAGIKRRGVTVMMALHDLTVARECADDLVVVKEGVIVYEASAAEISEERVRATFREG
jgi:ABC-type phosphate/phosphonate transport system ATPase subunit